MLIAILHGACTLSFCRGEDHIYNPVVLPESMTVEGVVYLMAAYCVIFNVEYPKIYQPLRCFQDLIVIDKADYRKRSHLLINVYTYAYYVYVRCRLLRCFYFTRQFDCVEQYMYHALIGFSCFCHNCCMILHQYT